MNFAFLDIPMFEASAQEWFGLLYVSTEPVVPGEFMCEEWRAA